MPGNKGNMVGSLVGPNAGGPNGIANGPSYKLPYGLKKKINILFKKKKNYIKNYFLHYLPNSRLECTKHTKTRHTSKSAHARANATQAQEARSEAEAKARTW